jgi:predicted alpha/beta superfamily hydrolase
MFVKSILAFVVLVFISGNVFSQNSEIEINKRDVSLNYSETHVLYSENVQDSFYIFIKLPKYYHKDENRTYPVIYLLDGDIAFPMAWSVVRYLQYGKYVPDIIIVGIGYGGLLYSSAVNNRERDYCISAIEGLSETGGADKFLNFMKEELMPFLESEYRIDKSNLTLSGHSLGGLFVLYSLFSEPYLFSNYIAGSPYTSYNVDELVELEKDNECEIRESKSKLFISFGAEEDEEKYLIPNNRIVNRLQQRDSSFINLKFRIFEEGIHFSTPAEAMAYGLMFMFE